MFNFIILKSMYKEKRFECHPIDGDLKEQFGEGYYYCITITTVYGDNEGEEEYTEWYVYQNGRFSSETHITSSFEPSQHIYCGGTFDSSKYNEYVKQMQEFKGDWEEELEYNDDLYEEYPPRRIFYFDVKRFEEEYLNK